MGWTIRFRPALARASGGAERFPTRRHKGVSSVRADRCERRLGLRSLSLAIAAVLVPGTAFPASPSPSPEQQALIVVSQSGSGLSPSTLAQVNAILAALQT